MQSQLASPATRVEELERAFFDFTQTSLQLENAYKELEDRVEVLSAALAQAQDERVVELAEKKRLAERLSRLLETLPAGVIVLDEQGKVCEYNPGAAALLGNKLSGRSWNDIVSDCFAREGDGAGEFKLKSGRTVSVATARLQAAEGRILLLTDVSETWRLRQLLLRNQRLSEMGQMNARLAHQLRTPLATAMLYASQLKTHESSPRSVRYANKIVGSLQHLERMVNDMLRFAGGTRPANYEQIPVNELFAEVAAQLESQLSENVVLEFGAPAELAVHGDREALAGALLNLATNAIENCPAPVQLTLDAVRADDQVILRVSDNGPGISAEHQDKIFEPFFTTRSNGTGLGLAVVASVVRGHDGRIEISDAKNGGAVFSLLLPNCNSPVIQSGLAATSLRTLK